MNEFQKNKFQPLTFHNLSLHNDANTRNYVAKPSQQNMKPKSTHTLPTGPHRAMRESRTATDKVAVSGNQHESQKTLKRKCRSVTALINRRVRRSLKRHDQRIHYRRIRAQCHDLAGQAAAYKAQDPTATPFAHNSFRNSNNLDSAFYFDNPDSTDSNSPLTHFTKITFYSTKS